MFIARRVLLCVCLFVMCFCLSLSSVSVVPFGVWLSSLFSDSLSCVSFSLPIPHPTFPPSSCMLATRRRRRGDRCSACCEESRSQQQPARQCLSHLRRSRRAVVLQRLVPRLIPHGLHWTGRLSRRCVRAHSQLPCLSFLLVIAQQTLLRLVLFAIY